MSGAFEPLPSRFMRWNTGDSLSLRRMYTENTSRISDTRNGRRQPQSAKVEASMVRRAPPITRSARKKPSVAVVWMKLVA